MGGGNLNMELFECKYDRRGNADASFILSQRFNLQQKETGYF